MQPQGVHSQKKICSLFILNNKRVNKAILPHWHQQAAARPPSQPAFICSFIWQRWLCSGYACQSCLLELTWTTALARCGCSLCLFIWTQWIMWVEFDCSVVFLNVSAFKRTHWSRAEPPRVNFCSFRASVRGFFSCDDSSRPIAKKQPCIYPDTQTLKC